MCFSNVLNELSYTTYIVTTYRQKVQLLCEEFALRNERGQLWKRAGFSIQIRNAHLHCPKPFLSQLQPSNSEHLDSLKGGKKSYHWVLRLTLTATLQALPSSRRFC